MPWRGPEYEGEVPTLGFGVLDWIAENLTVPSGPSQGRPLELTAEQAQFVLNFYKVDPRFRGRATRGRALVNARGYHRGILSRAKGWGKSPILGALCFVEALHDVVLDGWDAYGEPVARPWTSFGFKARVQVLATSEDQVVETMWDPMLEMARSSPTLIDDYGVNPMETFISAADVIIQVRTSAGDSREGGRPVFAVFDQTESWTPSNGGVALAAAVRRNLTKTQGTSIESPNAYRPGAGTVAEATFTAYEQQQSGRVKGKQTILLDHREAPEDTDPSDEASLRKGLAVAYGDSADVNGGWVNLDRVIEDYWDPSADPQDSRLYFLNQITHAGDSYLSAPVWSGRKDTEKVVSLKDPVVLGFDGSRGRAKGKPDATVLIGVRVEDGHVFEIGVWEAAGVKEKWPDWEPPIVEIEAKLDHWMTKGVVVGFNADPAKDWRSHVNKWEAKYAAKVADNVHKLTGRKPRGAMHPFEWWMTGGRSGLIQIAVEQFEGAVLNGDMTHDGSADLTRHMLNARRRLRHKKLTLGKEHDYSPNKIDAAIGAILAWQARLDAITAGVGQKKTRRSTKVGLL